MSTMATKKETFHVPNGWNLISAEDKPLVTGVADPLQEIRRALDHPIGSPKIEELARPGMEVALLFDDLQRPTPVHLALPEILNRLNRAGIPDNRITGNLFFRHTSYSHIGAIKKESGGRSFFPSAGPNLSARSSRF